MKRFLLLIAVVTAAFLIAAATVWGREAGPRAGGTDRRIAHRGHRTGRRHHRHKHHRRHRRKHPGSTATGPTSPTTGPTPPSPPVYSGTTTPVDPCPSAPPGNNLSLGGTTYALEGMDTFTKAAPTGSFAQATNDQIVYVGDNGMAWTGYPDGAPSSYSGGAEGYQPSTVLSVHDGMLDFYLHNDAGGHPVGADPSPLPGGNRYQTYGVWSFCEQTAPADSHNLADFKQAPLLWPVNDSDGPRAESDFPEATALNKLDFYGFAHYGGSTAQDYFDVRSVEPNFDPRQWHVYTQAWGPGFRSYYIDGQLVGTSTNQVWSAPERWQLQVEPSGANDGDSGHVYVKWVWIGTRT